MEFKSNLIGIIIFSLTIFSFFVLLLSYTPNVTVATDGSGNYQTVTAAVMNIPMNRQQQYVIFIKAGTYKESISVGLSMSNLVLIGEGMDKTIIEYSKSLASGVSTQDSATVGKLLFSHNLIQFNCKSHLDLALMTTLFMSV